MDWVGAAEIAGVVVLLLLLVPLVWLFVRRRWLSRQGGMFDCALRLERSGWVLGVARYSGEDLEWFRAVSLGVRPTVSFRRTSTMALAAASSDDPTASEELLYADQRMVRLETQGLGGARVWELAMPNDSATGLLAWLEAAPPSVGRFSS